MTQQINPIPDSWLILDSESTATVFKSSEYLNTIVVCGEYDSLTLISNGGDKLTYHMKSSLKFLPLNTFCNEKSHANIISLFNLVQAPQIIVMLDNHIDYGFNRQYNRKMHHFKPFHSGLYYYDISRELTHVNTVNPNTKGMLSTYSFI